MAFGGSELGESLGAQLSFESLAVVNEFTQTSLGRFELGKSTDFASSS